MLLSSQARFGGSGRESHRCVSAEGQENPCSQVVYQRSSILSWLSHRQVCPVTGGLKRRSVAVDIVLRWRSVRLLSQGVALKAEDLLPGVVTWEHGNMDRTWSRKQISCRFHADFMESSDHQC